MMIVSGRMFKYLYVGGDNAENTACACNEFIYEFIFLSVVTVEFDPTSYTVSESDAFANITVLKRGQTTQPVSVEFTTADDSAIG